MVAGKQKCYCRAHHHRHSHAAWFVLSIKIMYADDRFNNIITQWVMIMMITWTEALADVRT